MHMLKMLSCKLLLILFGSEIYLKQQQKSWYAISFKENMILQHRRAEFSFNLYPLGTAQLTLLTLNVHINSLASRHEGKWVRGQACRQEAEEVAWRAGRQAGSQQYTS